MIDSLRYEFLLLIIGTCASLFLRESERDCAVPDRTCGTFLKPILVKLSVNSQVLDREMYPSLGIPIGWADGCIGRKYWTGEL